MQFYGERLNNESWGEKVIIKGNNTLELSMSFQTLASRGYLARAAR